MSHSPPPHRPLRSVHGLLFLFVAIILFTVALILELLPLLLWGSFMMALIISIIVLVLIMYFYTMYLIASSSLEHVVSPKRTTFTLSFPTRRPLQLFLFIYEWESRWSASTFKQYSYSQLFKLQKTNYLDIPNPNRGVYDMTLLLRFTDIFGLFTIEIPLPHQKRLLIPAPIPQNHPEIPDMAILALQNLEQELSQSSPPQRSGDQFYDFKRYTIGDDIRSIDWRLFSRFNELFIKNRERYSAPSQLLHAMEIILPEPSIAGERQLDTLISIGQIISQSIMKHQLELYIGDSFHLPQFNGNSIEHRHKLAYVTTTLSRSFHTRTTSSCIFLVHYNQYQALLTMLDAQSNHVVLVLYEQSHIKPVSMSLKYTLIEVHFVAY
ncbi:DUF58 domain-containing protein [Entomospira entomophila]|uniref:DUF58 domain-containing protein n=1 Tax=Entomospira entomophila TaxID=2719988 RepID=A0A968KWM0_9SPIO|nr:DUF58 domain-containing protein [Entomospira entomophilus]NIZ40935.1 DUF58 domain-containing protein [Entomospira entomophilus]WDI35148.1 DUF58 domain-containing protein [Entomospira entomophilus]